MKSSSVYEGRNQGGRKYYSSRGKKPLDGNSQLSDFEVHLYKLKIPVESRSRERCYL